MKIGNLLSSQKQAICTIGTSTRSATTWLCADYLQEMMGSCQQQQQPNDDDSDDNATGSQ